MNRHGKDPGRKYRRCACPIHAEGHLGGIMYRKALDTTSWMRAQDLVREKESRGAWDDPQASPKVLIDDAVKSFLQGIAPDNGGKAKSTTRKIRALFLGVNAEWVTKTRRTFSAGLVEYCRHEGLTVMTQLTVPVLTDFTASWKCGPLHRSKRIQLLRRFFRFAMASEWCEKNPALELEQAKVKATRAQPTLPFDGETLPEAGPQWKAIMAQVQPNPKLLALTLLMRFAGLRISDACCFHQSRILPDKSILLYAHKTGEPVVVPIHEELERALAQITTNSAGYYFWSGESAVMTATDNWRRRFAQAFQRAGIEGGHPHRFRDTFAVDLLLRGVPIDQVSALLGHSAVKITEQHYLAFVAARRKQIAEAVRRAWASGASNHHGS
ncbi:MAG: site-specific integrase [Acidobacteriia bacterium]|nr:site-specific integrase [Terriglobia bacterium]